MNSTNNTNKGARHGWSTHWLVATIAYLPCIVIASSAPAVKTVANPALFSSSDTIKLLIALVTVIAVPFFRSVFLRRRENLAFKVFLKAHSKNAKLSFGGENSVSFVRDTLGINADWLNVLEAADIGVPSFLTEMQKSIDKALLPASQKSKYWPYIAYLGVNSENAPLGPESIIWKLKKPETKAAANYFISQEQVLSSLKTQYESPYFDLIKEGDQAARIQWCRRLESSIYDLAEHYVNIIKLRKVLKS